MQTIGPVLTDNGVRFTLYADGAQEVELCLFEPRRGGAEIRRVFMDAMGHGLWAAECRGVRPGQRYAFRVRGPYNPTAGLWFDPGRLLLDPYARAVDIAFPGTEVRDSVSGAPQTVNPRYADDGCGEIRCVIVDQRFDWDRDRPPRVPWRDTIIYECHVKGLTALHPQVPPAQRGRFMGVCSAPVIEHLHRLGVTTVQLMPVSFSMTRPWLKAKGLSNYWGYDSICFFAPDPRFASLEGDVVREFKTMVRTLHKAGIEVILDMVFNHTVEGDESGPTLCYRGLANAAYYRLQGGRYVDWTGCGNTLNTDHPIVRRLIVDCLRYWVEVMHVDGFRLDLAAALGRSESGFAPTHPLWRDILSDPVLAEVKWIAEPWDATPEGYALGRFPRPFAEWNDRYRDGVRRFWRGDEGSVADWAFAVTGSSNVFASDRVPLAGIQYVACHDGFTLRDLVSFEHKHNEANAEHNRDGSSQNFSRNWGVEGDTDIRRVLRMRERSQRNFLATLAMSLGVPMLTAGDEMNHTQRGNNNAYCQDNDIGWLAWPDPADQTDAAVRLREFSRFVLNLRRRYQAFRQEHSLKGEVICGCGLRDVVWLRPDGHPMLAADWHDPRRLALAMLRHVHGEPGDTLLLMVNASADVVRFRLPALTMPGQWRRIVNTLRTVTTTRQVTRDDIRMAAYSLILLEYHPLSV